MICTMAISPNTLTLVTPHTAWHASTHLQVEDPTEDSQDNLTRLHPICILHHADHLGHHHLLLLLAEFVPGLQQVNLQVADEEED